MRHAVKHSAATGGSTTVWAARAQHVHLHALMPMLCIMCGVVQTAWCFAMGVACAALHVAPTCDCSAASSHAWPPRCRTSMQTSRSSWRWCTSATCTCPCAHTHARRRMQRMAVSSMRTRPCARTHLLQSTLPRCMHVCLLECLNACVAACEAVRGVPASCHVACPLALSFPLLPSWQEGARTHLSTLY